MLLLPQREYWTGTEHVGQVVVIMSGYIDDVLKSSGIPGTSRTLGTDGLFEVRDSMYLRKCECGSTSM
jgi:hypothetical protein